MLRVHFFRSANMGMIGIIFFADLIFYWGRANLQWRRRANCANCFHVSREPSKKWSWWIEFLCCVIAKRMQSSHHFFVDRCGA